MWRLDKLYTTVYIIYLYNLHLWNDKLWNCNAIVSMRIKIIKISIGSWYKRGVIFYYLVFFFNDLGTTILNLLVIKLLFFISRTVFLFIFCDENLIERHSMEGWT